MITTTTIFDKTAKGREEIATRQHHIAPRLRTLLLLVDGKRDVVELMAKVAGLGLDKNALDELLKGEFIQQAEPLATAADAVAPTEPAPIPATQPLPLVKANLATEITTTTDAPATSPAGPNDTNDTTDKSATQTAAPDSAIDRIATDDEGPLRSGESQFQAITSFFTETIRSAIGLRGFTMQLKVERASTIADLRALRDPYLEAVLKSKGPELERSLRNRLDQLFALGD
ncbi:MAG: hypothetical protein V4695_09195 [Pseudomonadota bacterium]